MHELSIVMSIVDIAEKQAMKANAKEIEQIELEIGELSGVDMPSFSFAWKQGIKNSFLQNADLLIKSPKGKAKCLECSTEFDIHQLFDACPTCQSHFIDIFQGKELKVKSLVVK